MIAITFGPGDQYNSEHHLTVRADSWYDARDYAMRVFKTDKLWEEDIPVAEVDVHIEWSGTDAGRTQARVKTIKVLSPRGRAIVKRWSRR